MDTTASLALPVHKVFARLADPARLGDWVSEVVAVSSGPVSVDEAVTLVLRLPGGDVVAHAELVDYEPPRAVAYRLTVDTTAVHVLRVTCSWDGAATRVQVRQQGGQPDTGTTAVAPLSVDLSGLASTATATPVPAPPHRSVPALVRPADPC